MIKIEVIRKRLNKLDEYLSILYGLQKYIAILNHLQDVTSTPLSDRAVVERSRDTNHVGLL